jgi:hypothetical protein
VSAFTVLAIDPGASSGAAIFTGAGALVGSHQLARKEAGSRMRIVRHAVRIARDSETDLIVMREQWQAGGKRANPQMIAGLGAAWGLWLEQLYMNAPFLPPNRVLKVYPSTWKSKVLDAHAVGTEAWLKLVHRYVESRFGLTGLGDDEAVAICIGCYALKAPAALKVAQDKPRWHKAAGGTW